MPFTGDAETIVGDIQEFVTGERECSASDLERILATVMFTDIVDSTRSAAEMGDQQWRRLLDSHDRIAKQAVEKHRGVSSFEPSEGADQMRAGEEIAGSFFVTGCDASELFDELKETLDEVAFGVEGEVAIARELAIRFWRMTGLMARASRLLMKAPASQPLSPRRASGCASAARAWAWVMSWTWPPVRLSANGLPKASTITWILVVRPPRSWWSGRRASGLWLGRSPLFACARTMLMGSDDGGVDHGVFVVRIVSQRLEKTLPNTALRPPREPRVNGLPVAETLGQIAPRRP